MSRPHPVLRDARAARWSPRAGPRTRPTLGYPRAESAALRLAVVLPLLVSPVTTRAQSPGPTSPDTIDLFSWASGAFAVRIDPGAGLESAAAALDGHLNTVTIGTPRREPLPHRFVVELPSLTTFERFVIPVMNEFGPARGRHVGTIRIEASSEGPESGFTELATLTPRMDQRAPQEFAVPDPRPARWIRVELVDRLLAPPADFDPHSFSELIGYGRREPIVVPGDRFTGRWVHRRLGINDPPYRNNVIELVQDGDVITGCQALGGAPARITGSIVEGLARLIIDPLNVNGGTPVVATVTSEGELAGARFVAGSSAFWAAPDSTAASPCGDEAEAADPIVDTLMAGAVAVIHGINFDVDSDLPRPDAEPALQRLLGALQEASALSVTIEGHTDSDGDEARNLDLSRRRAASIVEWLTARGIAAGRLTPVGQGEAEPIADNDSSAGRALNRRVEVEPS